MNKISIPTGFIIIDDDVETLSIGDYGKENNIKADFLGYSNEIKGVSTTKVKPLQEKWVMTLSTQKGCSMNCTFCDVPNIPFTGNVSMQELWKQFKNAVSCFPDVHYTDRLNIHFARMGEPMFNFEEVYNFASYLGSKDGKLIIQKDLKLRFETIHPVLTTASPKTPSFGINLLRWCNLKNDMFKGQAGLQLSINSTNEDQRKEMFNNRSLTLQELSEICKTLPEPIGRKYCLNFALADEYEIDGKKLSELFSPDNFMVKITPIHNNNACEKNNIKTTDGYTDYPYKKAEDSFKNAGFDVLIFVPSMDEENSCITCGNAILSGSKIKL